VTKSRDGQNTLDAQTSAVSENAAALRIGQDAHSKPKFGYGPNEVLPSWRRLDPPQTAENLYPAVTDIIQKMINRKKLRPELINNPVAALGAAIRIVEMASDEAKYKKIAAKEAVVYGTDPARWQMFSDYAENAHKNLARLLSFMASPEGDRLPRHVREIQANLRIEMNCPQPVQARIDRSRAEGQMLIDTLAILKRLNQDAKRRHDAVYVQRTQGQHDGHSWTRLFVLRMAEGWVQLTGKPPGKGKDKNTFADFLHAACLDGAWAYDDVKRSGESEPTAGARWHRHIRTALKSLDVPELDRLRSLPIPS
jgi:hypothetical protein